jgi:hypothetical protein
MLVTYSFSASRSGNRKLACVPFTDKTVKVSEEGVKKAFAGSQQGDKLTRLELAFPPEFEDDMKAVWVSATDFAQDWAKAEKEAVVGGTCGKKIKFILVPESAVILVDRAELPRNASVLPAVSAVVPNERDKDAV